MAVKLKTGDLVNVVVLKQIPHALLVKLLNGAYGIIRNRELSWQKPDASVVDHSSAQISGLSKSERSTQSTIGMELQSLVSR